MGSGSQETALPVIGLFVDQSVESRAHSGIQPLATILLSATCIASAVMRSTTVTPGETILQARSSSGNIARSTRPSVRPAIRERTSAGLAQARPGQADGRVGGHRRKLNHRPHTEIADSVLSDRKIVAEMARIFKVNQPTVSRIVAAHRREVG